MREIHSDKIVSAVRDAVIKANIYLPSSLCEKIEYFAEKETVTVAKSVFSDMKDNLKAAHEFQIPICQDCGMAVIFAEVGQNVHISGEAFENAVNRGVASGYKEGYLRKSIVKDPLFRENTEDNTPAVIHTRIVPGDKIKLTVAPKGFGSENMSKIKMFNPTATKEDIIDFVVSVVKEADAKPCPPVVIGVGIGGDFEYAPLLSKKALCRDVNVPNGNEYYMEMEKEILDAVNKTGIGPQGFSGDCTALACNIEVYPTHIAGLPVAVNIGCHVTRHVEVEL
ncbi:MAG: fumarate hydratase [Clostridia bacterium]|nr:fumarate hydratase [Clostridia bacterium]